VAFKTVVKNNVLRQQVEINLKSLFTPYHSREAVDLVTRVATERGVHTLRTQEANLKIGEILNDLIRTRQVTLSREWDEGSLNLIKISLNEYGWATTLEHGDLGELRVDVVKAGALENSQRVFQIAVDRLLNGSQHGFTGFASVAAAFQEAEALAPEWVIRSRSALRFVYELGTDCSDAGAVAAAAADLGSKGKLSLSTFGTEKQSRLRAEAASQREIASLIQRITLGKTLFVLPQSLQRRFLGCDYGRSRNVESESFLAGKPVEVLREIVEAVEAYRNARDNKTSTISPSKVDSPDGIDAGYRPTRQQTDLSHQAQPAAADDLINPATQQRYSRSEILRLIQTDLAAFRKLKQQNVRLLDQILQSRN